MKLLKKYFPELKKIDGITMLNGKPYINHPGLLYLAQGKIHSKTTRMLVISNVEKGDFYFECTIVTTDGRTFNGHGNGNAKNIKGVAKDRAFEMAEVRAQNRALREMLALGDTTAEEIDEGAALHGDADAVEEVKDLPHDKQWERDRKYFMVRLKELNFAYEVVVYMLQVMDKPRPSQMPAPKRTALLDWLADLSPQTRERWEEDYAVNVLGAPSKGDTNV